MCGTFRKPQVTVAKVHTDQIIKFVHTKLQNKEHPTEALCKAKFKFPGRQKVHISKKRGFAKFNVDESETRWLKSGSSRMAEGPK